MSEANSDQASFPNQDSDRNKASVDVTLPQCQQEPAAAGQREAEASCLHKTLEAEKHVVEETLLPSQNVSGNVTPATSRTYSQREEPILDPETNANQTGKDKVEIPTVEFGRSSSQRHKESPQNILPACVLALGSCASASSDVPTGVKEEDVALPPKKKQCVALPAERATEQSEIVVQSQPINGPEVSRKETRSAVLTSDESGVLCDPGCADQEHKPQGEPGACPTAVCSEQQQTRNLTEAVGLELPDYVSDSQLNTITLTEDLIMERDHHSPECPDATDLMCGLTRELSSLNRKVMAAHRELESLHRSSKSSRSSLR